MVRFLIHLEISLQTLANATSFDMQCFRYSLVFNVFLISISISFFDPLDYLGLFFKNIFIWGRPQAGNDREKGTEDLKPALR